MSVDPGGEGQGAPRGKCCIPARLVLVFWLAMGEFRLARVTSSISLYGLASGLGVGMLAAEKPFLAGEGLAQQLYGFGVLLPGSAMTSAGDR